MESELSYLFSGTMWPDQFQVPLMGTVSLVHNCPFFLSVESSESELKAETETVNLLQACLVVSLSTLRRHGSRRLLEAEEG